MASVNGILEFTLKEKKDRNKRMYLFGGIHFINSVLFIRPTGEVDNEGCPIWEAQLKPYRGPREVDLDDPERVEEPLPPQSQPNRRQRP